MHLKASISHAQWASRLGLLEPGPAVLAGPHVHVHVHWMGGVIAVIVVVHAVRADDVPRQRAGGRGGRGREAR